jgi:uncharacterized surface protein with fasciclin (FAS1) repeats
MDVLHRTRMFAVIAALMLFAAACNGGATDDTGAADDPAEDPGVTETDDGAMDDGAMDDGTDDAAMDDGAMDDGAMDDTGDDVAMVDVGCQVDLPEDGPGSADGMAQDPAATAASNNPELSTLVEAVTQAGLVDTLNDPEATYTIFAPANSAFEGIPEEDLNALLADQEALTEVLTFHVVGDQELSLQELVDEGSVAVLQGGEVTIEAMDEQTVMINGQQAQVICADVETANATVHIIDGVLMPDMGAAGMDDGMEAEEEATE